MLWLVLLAVFSLLFGLWGYVAANSRGRSPILWAIVCALTFFVGIAIVYSLGDPLTYADHGQHAQQHDHGDTGRDEDARQPVRLPAAPAPPQPPVAIVTSEPADDRKWRYLCDYHPRISEAVRRIEPLGETALEELKSAYLALNDATLLPGILRRVEERFGGGTRGAGGMADPFRQLTLPAEDEEPIDLSSPLPVETAERTSERNGYVLNSARPSRLTRQEIVGETPPPANEQRQARDDLLDGEREQAAWRSAFDKDRLHRSETAAAPVSMSSGPATSSASSLQGALESSRTPPTERAGRMASGTTLNAGPNGGSGASNSAATTGLGSHGLVKEPPNRIERRDEAPPQKSAQNLPPVQVDAATTRPPEHRTVAPADLSGARYVETYGGLHLFALADGRVFVDRHEALGSLDQARVYVDGLKA